MGNEEPRSSHDLCWPARLYHEIVRDGRIKRLPHPALQSLSGNDYLGLAQHPAVLDAAIAALEQFGAGASGSRFLSGNNPLNAELEEAIARFKSGKGGVGLVFSSGYHANLSVMSVLGSHCDRVYSDRSNHASLIDGLRLSPREVLVYPHGDWEWVRDHIRKTPPSPFMIVTESLFSMDGDMAPLRELSEIVTRSGGMLVIDDAHATGTTGTTGRGGLEACGLEFDPDHMILTGTFSKAMGSLGGYAVASKNIREILLSLSRPFIYTTGLPPASLAASLASLTILDAHPEMVSQLQGECQSWNRALVGVSHASPIIPVRGPVEHLRLLSSRMEKEGYFLPVLCFPTVPEGREQLRLSVNRTWSDAIRRTVASTFQVAMPDQPGETAARPGSARAT